MPYMQYKYCNDECDSYDNYCLKIEMIIIFMMMMINLIMMVENNDAYKDFEMSMMRLIKASHF